MFGNPFQGILGPPGPLLGHFRSRPSCHPTSPLDTFTDIRAPRPHLASFAKPSTCPKDGYVLFLSKVCYLPSLQHVSRNSTLQCPKIQPNIPVRHPEIRPRSPKIAQHEPKMTPTTCANHRLNPRIICLETLFWPSCALLALLGPVLGHFRSQVAIKRHLWTPPGPNYELQNPILQALLSPRPAQNTIICIVFARFAACHLRTMLLSTLQSPTPR